jgi:diguanylate cyclase (GGDEF)-like protein
VPGFFLIVWNIDPLSRRAGKTGLLPPCDQAANGNHSATKTPKSPQTKRACYGALLFLDLDKFKELNDGHGHSVGDLLLIEVSKRLTACVRKKHTVARYGRDEFVILLGELNKAKADSTLMAQVIAEKIRLSLAAPYRLAIHSNEPGDDSIDYQCTASIGVVVFLSDKIAFSDILKWADAAMYQAKTADKNAIRFYKIDPHLEESEAPTVGVVCPVQ